MKKYKVIMSTSYGHEIYFNAKNEDDAVRQANNISQEEIDKQSINKWDVETFPMIVDVEEEKCQKVK
tara:strand:- start:15 stop:215 length:201 start_codon:yes stop_codon:yes gene_type:complete